MVPARSEHSRMRIWAIATALVLVAIGLAAWLMRERWLPMNAAQQGGAAKAAKPAEHEHEHASGSSSSIEVSDTGLRNIGFTPATVSTQSFERVETIPAMIVERPGKTQIHVTAPFTGVITKINVVEGEAVEPGSMLFELRLTHEELVNAQQEYLKTAESLDVVDREITRLQSLGEGVIAGKRVLEQQYEKQKFEASLRAAEQALLLHGLSEDQVTAILKTRKLLQTIAIYAPPQQHTGEACSDGHSFHVQQLPVSLGQQIDAGLELCVLADHCELYIEGRAFEDDAEQLRTAAREGWDISASLLTQDAPTKTIDGLKLLYLSDSIDPESRAFRFYLLLPNQVVLNQKNADGNRFIEWRFKPGQRMELRIPVEQWTDQIVLPQEAIVEEGAERFVYRQNGKSFERVPVHVEYRDGKAAIVEKGGALFPGDVVAGKGAYQMHLQLKNKSGGGVDPHAGHNH
jgi:cobalt-zinc-cadmium efflux system membrane fusion protein